MNYLAFLYIFALFYVFIPGTVITLPVKASKMVHTMIHALLFSIILFFTYHSVSLFSLKEGAVSANCKKHCKKSYICGPDAKPDGYCMTACEEWCEDY